MSARLHLFALLIPFLLQPAGVGVSSPAAPRSGAPAAMPAAVAQAPTGQRPQTRAHTTVWDAIAAVEGDSVDQARARYEERVRRDPRDRDALLGLATLDRLLSRYDSAIVRYKALDRDGHAIDAFTANARYGMAAAIASRGDRKGAAVAYERAVVAARASGDLSAEVIALLGVVRARSRLQGPLAALALLDSMAPMIPVSDLRLRATYAAGRGAILAQLGRAEAREVALDCIDMARRARTRRVETACYQPLAMDAERRGDTRPAIDVLERAAALNIRAHDYWALANTLQLRGHLLSTRGEYGRARAVLREAVANGEASGNGVAVAQAWLKLAAISRLTQDRAAASTQVARSLAAFRKHGDVSGAMEARELEIALASDAGDYARARRLATEQLEWSLRVGRPRLAFSALVAQSSIAQRQRDWSTALARIDSAEALMTRHGMDGWADVLWYHQGLVALRRGDLAAAEKALKATLEVLDPLQQIYRYRTRARLAEVYARRGELDRAERELATAGTVLDAWRGQITDEELRIAAFQIADDEDPDLGVPRVVAALAASGRVESAFAIAERRRARDLADRLARAAALRAEGAATAPTLAPMAAATAAGVAAALPDPGTAVLEYVTGDVGAPTTLFILSREDGRAAVRAVMLPAADSLSLPIARFVALLEGGAQPRALARALGAALLDSALALLGPDVTRLVVVPDGPLHRVPFDALRLRDGRYAVERFAVSAAPSAAIAAALWQRPRPSPADAGPVRLLAFGDPAFASEEEAPWNTGRSGPARASAALASAGSALPRLAQSGREARLVAAYAAHAVVRLRGEASGIFLKTTPLRGFRVIHFATHALVDDRIAARTMLALAPGGGESGFVAPGDLAALRLDADLVVLSACHTAGGVVVTGEGVQGLTAPLLQAGARAVVATGWRIDDGRTVSFVDDFYAGLADGRPAVDALRAAKLKALHAGAPPGDWAAFTIVGDPLVTVPLKARRPLPAWWGALVVASAAAAGAITYLKRRQGPRIHR